LRYKLTITVGDGTSKNTCAANCGQTAADSDSIITSTPYPTLP